LAPESKPSLESLISALKAGPADPRARAQIVYGIAEAAPVADLVAMARGKDANLRLAALEALALKPRTAFTDADRAAVRPILLDALDSGDRALGTAAAGALPNAPPTSLDPRILRLLGGKGYARGAIVQALVGLGPEIVPKLAAALQGEGRDLRDGAAIVLAGFGPDARPAIPALIEAALDDPAAAQEFARAILATKDLDACAALFADPRMPERQRFGEALAAAGVDALPHFDKLRRHADPAVRRESVRLFARLGKAAVPWLLEAAEDKDAAVANAALRSLGRAVPSEVAIPVLVRALGDDALRDAAVQTLRSHGAAARDALDALAADPRPEVRAAAFSLLAPLGETAVARVTEALGDPDPTVRASAASALGRLGAEATPALPGLRALLADPASPVRRAAASALGQLGATAVVAVPDLLELLRKGDGGDRAAAGQALVSIGPAAAPALASLLSQPDEAVRRAAQEALARMGESAVPAIVAVMDSDDATRREAATTLARRRGVRCPT
jgi:HEAT repeat protein